jgi:catechol 2,3-dioxygenase-like lactoylglutathione lyase family enzyme
VIRGIHHTSLSTLDADRLLHFYRDLLGLEQLWDLSWDTGSEPLLDKVVGMASSGGRAATLRAGNSFIEIFEYSSPRGNLAPQRPACDAGIRHLCFDVVDIQDEYERLRDAGVPFHSEPQVLMGVVSTYGRDPDGNIFELQEILPDSVVPHIPHLL